MMGARIKGARTKAGESQKRFAEIGERIKDVRTKAGESQKRFAEKLGISLRAVQDYETGKNTPGGKVLQKICTLCGVDGHWLLTGEGEMEWKARRGRKASESIDNDPLFLPRQLASTGRQLWPWRVLTVLNEAPSPTLREEEILKRLAELDWERDPESLKADLAFLHGNGLIEYDHLAGEATSKQKEGKIVAREPSDRSQAVLQGAEILRSAVLRTMADEPRAGRIVNGSFMTQKGQGKRVLTEMMNSVVKIAKENADDSGGESLLFVFGGAFKS